MQENPEKQGLSLWFVALAAVFVICLITANIIAVKLLPAAVIFFPVSDIVGHMITEVYGSRQARRVIWLGFACNLRAVFLTVAFAGVRKSGYTSLTAFLNRVLSADQVRLQEQVAYTYDKDGSSATKRCIGTPTNASPR